MFSRGQVTTAIVFGLLMLFTAAILISVLFVTQKSTLELEQRKVQAMNADVLSAIPAIEQCIRQQTVLAVFLATQQERDHEFGLPGVSEFEQVIEDHLKSNLRLCPDFSKIRGVEVVSGVVEAGVVLTSTDIIVRVDWPVAFVQGDITVRKEEFRTEIPISFLDLYAKVKTMSDHDVALDIGHIMQQDIDVEIAGCVDDFVRLVVNDERFVVDKNVLRLLFHEKLENISSFFEFEDGLRFVPYQIEGKHVLRNGPGGSKVVFETDQDGQLLGCWKQFEHKSQYIFGLVEGESVPLAVISPVAGKVVIKSVSDELYNISADFEFQNGLLLSKRLLGIPEQSVNGKWVKLESISNGGYLLSNLTSIGLIRFEKPVCSVLKQGKFNIAFVPSSYGDLSKFYLDVDRLFMDFLKVEPLHSYSSLFGGYAYNQDVGCDSWMNGNCSESMIKSRLLECGEIDWTVVLDNGGLRQFEHITDGKITYVNTALQGDEFCIECNMLHEFGLMLGLNKTESFNLRDSISVSGVKGLHYPLNEYVLPPVLVVWSGEETISGDIRGEPIVLKGELKDDGARYSNLESDQYMLHKWNNLTLTIDGEVVVSSFFPINVSKPLMLTQDVMSPTVVGSVLVSSKPYFRKSDTDILDLIFESWK